MKRHVVLLCSLLFSLAALLAPRAASAQRDAGVADAAPQPAVDRAAPVLRRGPLHVPPIPFVDSYSRTTGRVIVLGSPQHARAAWWVPDDPRDTVAPLASWPSAVRVVDVRGSSLLTVESVASFGRPAGQRFVIPLMPSKPIRGSYADIYGTALVGATSASEAASSERRPLWETGGLLCGTARTCRNIARLRARAPVTFEALELGEPLRRRSVTLTPVEYNALIQRVYCEPSDSLQYRDEPVDDHVVPVEHATIAAAVLRCEAHTAGMGDTAQIVGWIAKGPALVRATSSPPRAVAALRAASSRTQLWMRENTVGAARLLGEAPLLAGSASPTIAVVVDGQSVHVLVSDGVAVRDNVLYEWGAESLATHARFADVDGDGVTDVLVHGRSSIRDRPTPAGSIVYFVREPGVGLRGELERDFATQSLLVTDDPDEAVRRALAHQPAPIDPADALRFVDSRPIRAFAAAIERATRRYAMNPPSARAAIAAVRARATPTAQLLFASATTVHWTALERIDDPDADEYDALAGRLANTVSRYFLCQPRRAVCVHPAGDRPDLVFTFVPSPRGPLIDRIVMLDTG